MKSRNQNLEGNDKVCVQYKSYLDWSKIIFQWISIRAEQASEPRRNHDDFMNNLIVASFLVLSRPRHYMNGVICQKKRHHTLSYLRVILVKLPLRDGGGPQEVCPKHSFIASGSS